jgi:hypothetical protein
MSYELAKTKACHPLFRLEEERTRHSRAEDRDTSLPARRSDPLAANHDMLYLRTSNTRRSGPPLLKRSASSDAAACLSERQYSPLPVHANSVRMETGPCYKDKGESQPVANLQSVVDSIQDVKTAPPTLDIRLIGAGLRDLWKRSMQYSPPREVGACIVAHVRGIRLDFVNVGDVARVQPACSSAQHQQHLGFAHTHPTPPGAVGFSPSDFRATLEDRDRISIVCSGELVFALLRLKDTVSPNDRAVASMFEVWDRVKQNPAEHVRRNYGMAGLVSPLKPAVSRDYSPAQVMRKLNDESCRLLHFVWYEGTINGNLVRM